MFGLGKKNKAVPEQSANPWEADCAAWIYDFLSQNINGAVKAENAAEGVQVPELGLRIWANFYRQHPQILQMMLHCDHPDFTDEVGEMLVAPGATTEESLHGLAEQAMAFVVQPLQNGLLRQKGSWTTLSLRARHKFFISESYVMSRCKNQELFQEKVPQNGLWQQYQEQILPYIGCKRNYWLKLYQSNFGGELNCEVRINERLIPELTQLLTDDAAKYELVDWDQKQTVALLQDAATCPEYKFSAAKVRQLALEALRLYASGLDSDEVGRKLLALTGDISVSADLSLLLPEICCFKCLNDADTPDKRLILRCPNWHDDLTLRESQLGYYDWCEQALGAYLVKYKPDKDTLARIIGYSATGKALNAALQKGGQLKNLRHTMLFNVPEGYILH